MNAGIIVALIVLAAALVLLAVAARQRTRLHQRLLEDVRAGDFADFDRRVDSTLARMTLSTYTRAILRFRAAAAQGDEERAVQEFDRALALEQPGEAKAALLQEGFDAFLTARDRAQAKKVLDAMTPDVVADQARRQCEEAYRQTFYRRGFGPRM